MAENWAPIFLSAKVFGHLAQGLYRTPAGAIKELISNSFDADAKNVKIHTDFPRFETFSCEDDGTGISEDEFLRLMNRGIGSSFKRINERTKTEVLQRPLIGRLGLGILAIAQICTQFEIISHHKATKTAFRAVIKFPPYTREEMDKIDRKVKKQGEDRIQGGEYQFIPEAYNSDKVGVKVFTRYLRESFRKRMRTLPNFANKKAFGATGPYKTFDRFLDAIYQKKHPTQSLNLLSDYDELIFGLALTPPLPYSNRRNVAIKLPSIDDRQTALERFNFRVQVDNLSLSNPVCLPSDKATHTATDCEIGKSHPLRFTLEDGSIKETCKVTRYTISVTDSDEQFNAYEFRYSNDRVAGSALSFRGYLFQQNGRLYPRDIQGVLIRLGNVAIGKYDNSMLGYPYAEGPRYSMVSSEIFIERGFEDALNIDRDSFNELHPHYVRVQSYVYALLHDLIFPETWGQEKKRNKTRRENESKTRETNFLSGFRKTTGDTVKSIERIERPRTKETGPNTEKSPINFDRKPNKIEIDLAHPLLQPLVRRKKHAALAEKLAVAFERANRESTPIKRRELFYKLLAEIFSEL